MPCSKAMPTPLQRYFIRLSYMGGDYCGWQVQENAPSVQAELEGCLELLLRKKVRLTGAGRTDTGVHAREFYAHFDIHPGLHENALGHLAFKCNRILPKALAIHGIYPVEPTAHARFHAISRTYSYTICTRKDPFMADQSWLIERPLDLNRMQDAAELLLEYSDFSSFARSNTQVKTHICKLDMARWEQRGHMLHFSIRADRFLRNMVRAITGSLVDVGLGKNGVEDFRSIIEARDRQKAGYSAPAQGLVLEQISYPQHLLPPLQ